MCHLAKSDKFFSKVGTPNSIIAKLNNANLFSPKPIKLMILKRDSEVIISENKLPKPFVH